jgi:hypothetical protein
MDFDGLGEIGGLVIGLILTIFVFSYLLKDNPLYRLAVHLLVGVSAAYALVIVARQVLWPTLSTVGQDVSRPANVLWLVPIFLGILLLFKLVPRLAWFGNSSMAVLMATGVGTALVGAFTGTLLPLVTAVYGGQLAGIGAALLTICVLFYFHFSGRLTADGQVQMAVWQRYIGFVGRVVITITLGALYASAMNTSLVLLVERVRFFIEAFGRVF